MAKNVIAAICLVLLSACGGAPDQPAADYAEAVRNLAVARRSVEVGDPVIHQGFLDQSDAGYEFRPCGKTEVYLIDGPFNVLDALDQFHATTSAAAVGAVYVRFHGREFELGAPAPVDSVAGVWISELLVMNDSPVNNCN